VDVGAVWNAPAPDASTWLDHVKEVVEPDGVRILEDHQRSPTVTQSLLSTNPYGVFWSADLLQ
jgi:hypothetical protein